MSFVTYVLLSKVKNRTYVGSTNDLDRRLKEHNSGINYSTKRYMPWLVIYIEEFNNLSDARKREKYLKSASGRRLVLKKLFI